MSKSDSRSQRELAIAARELLLLDKKITLARTLMASLQRELLETKRQLKDKLQVDQLIEANQQLVLAMLGDHSDPASPADISLPELYLDTREANEQLVIAALSAQSLQATAELALAQQKGVLAKVAHELRNPLTPISMLAERMVNMPTEDLPRMRALIEGQIQHMSRMVEDLLDVSRAGSGKLRLNRLEIDLIQLTQDAIDTCGPVMNAKNLNFSAHYPDEVVKVNGDPIRLTQVLHNLLTNAAKYTPDNGVIELSVALLPDVVKVCISDNGIGIAAHVLPFIFDAYVQDVKAIGFNGSGLGIGLTVVRELVKAHGGKVHGSSEGEGKGSQFIVTLPLAHEQKAVKAN